MKINKLNKELLVLKEDYAKMIVKSYKSRSEQSRAMFILSAENFYRLIKSAVFKAIYQ
jgi:thermostable 8-oxoguanine DNA glycosylase